MPGFLDVYGYYSPELKAWNIDVHTIITLSCVFLILMLPSPPSNSSFPP